MIQIKRFSHISEDLKYLKFWPCIGYYKSFLYLFLYKVLGKMNINVPQFYPRKNIAIKFMGIKMVVHPDHEDFLYYSGAAKLHFTEKWFEPEKDENVIDIGSNVGRYSLIAAKRKANVISFEADPETFRILLQNCLLNRFNKIRPFNFAVSNKTGMIELFRAEGFDGISTVDQNWILENGRTITERRYIQSDKLDNLNNFYHVDWLLIDVEGHELEVLEGAAETLKITKKIIIEVEKADREKVLTMLKNFEIVEEREESELSNYIFLVRI